MNIKYRKIAISTPFLGKEEHQATLEPIKSGWVAQGPKVVAFEKSIAKYVGTKDAVACSSGTAALHLMLTAMGICEGDEVIVPAYTWIATSNAVLYCNATPVFVDVDPVSFNLNTDDLKKKITSKTKAILIVHSFGLCCNMDQVNIIAGKIPVIEDAACALGSSYKGTKAGNLGFAAAFSFHPRKIITTGEGGAVTTNNTKLAEKMRALRNHGATLNTAKDTHEFSLPEFSDLGFNYRLTDIQAAIGLAQMNKLESIIFARQKWAELYFEGLKDCSFFTLPFNLLAKNSTQNWQSFVITLTDKTPGLRTKVMNQLKEAGIATRAGTTSIIATEYYQKKFNINQNDFPNTNHAHDFSFSIPMHNQMIDEDFAYVIQELKQLNPNQ